MALNNSAKWTKLLTKLGLTGDLSTNDYNTSDKNSLSSMLEAGDGMTVITTNSGVYKSRQQGSFSSRAECVPPLDITHIRLVYANWYTGGTGETPNTNPIRVRASIQPQGASVSESTTDPIYRVTFGGRDYGMCGRGAMLMSDLIPIAFLTGLRFFIKTYATGIAPAAPSAPSIAASGSGSSLAAGTYGVSLTIMFPDGVESASSASTSVTVTAGQNIVVTAPTAVVGAFGYRVWMSYVAIPAGENYYDTGSGIVAFGANFTITSSIQALTKQGIEQVDPSGLLYVPTGGDVLGGTAAGGSNNGEGATTGADRTPEGRRVAGNDVLPDVYAPVAVLGYNNRVRQHSWAIIGDSISYGIGDHGFGYKRGGFQQRAIMNQVNQNAYNPAIPPPFGHVRLGQSSETAFQFAGTAGFKRSMIANLCTKIWSNYGTNDLERSSSASANVVNSLYIIAKRFIDQGKDFYQSDLGSKTTSTDGWVTLANQLMTTSVVEAARRAVNNWMASTTGQVAVASENLFRGYTGTKAYTYDVYAGGDGSIASFYSAYPFVQGTESVTVNGVTKVLTTDYTYIATQTIAGVNYASGVLFGAAPANALTVRMSYTKMAGMVSMLGARCHYVPVAASVTINSAGAADKNGGFCKLSEAALLGPRAVTAITGFTLDDTTQAWTQDQWRGYSLMIVTDTVTPAAVGQVITIQYNSATRLTFVYAPIPVTPSSSATYKIFKCYQTDGIHWSTLGHIEMAKMALQTLF